MLRRATDVRSQGNMASTGGVTADGGDMMRYNEYTPKTKVRSDAEIDRRLVSICFHTGQVRGVGQTEAVGVFTPPARVSGNLNDR